MKEDIYKAEAGRYDGTMKYRRCGRSGVLLPEISLGLWQNFGDTAPLARSRDMLHRAFDLGITHFDLANKYGPSYGSAEETFGRVMAGSFAPYRDELFIATKAGYDMWPGPYGNWGSRKYLMASLDQSLHRMNLEYVDLFYSHRYDPETPHSQPQQAIVIYPHREPCHGALCRRVPAGSPQVVSPGHIDVNKKDRHTQDSCGADFGQAKP